MQSARTCTHPSVMHPQPEASTVRATATSHCSCSVVLVPTHSQHSNCCASRSPKCLLLSLDFMLLGHRKRKNSRCGLVASRHHASLSLRGSRMCATRACPSFTFLLEALFVHRSADHSLKASDSLMWQHSVVILVKSVVHAVSSAGGLRVAAANSARLMLPRAVARSR